MTGIKVDVKSKLHKGIQQKLMFLVKQAPSVILKPYFEEKKQNESDNNNILMLTHINQICSYFNIIKFCKLLLLVIFYFSDNK